MTDSGTPPLTLRCGPPVGRIAVRAGTRHAPTVRELQTMLRAFRSQGRWDLLLAIRDRQLTPLYALTLWRQNRLTEIPEARVVPPFRDAAYAWSDSRESPSHRRATRATFRRLPDGAIGDLPDLLRRVRSEWPHRTWNMAREHVSGFLRDELDPTHPLYRAVRALRPWPTEPREKGRPRSVDEARAIAEALGGLAGRMWWTLCITGMRNIEYWGDEWEEQLRGIQIPTAKKRKKPRLVPRIAPTVRPALGERWFRRKLVTVGAKLGLTDLQVYDARRTYARWMEEAGIIKTNRDAYMGHGARTVSDLYTAGILPGQLAADAAKLRAYIGPNPHLLGVVA